MGWKLALHYMVALLAYGTGVGCYLLIARNVELTEAVKEGVAVLGSDNVSVLGWLCLGLFWTLVVAYYHREFAHDLAEGLRSIRFVCTGCKVKGQGDEKDVELESVFNVPGWQNAPQEFKDFLEKTKSQMIRDHLD